MNRRGFIQKTGALIPGMLLTRILFSQQQTKKPPPIESEIVKEYVQVAHNDLNRVKELLEKHPLLLNAAWDWGGGDFETALEAAGHMGLKNTANYLLDKGARANIFVLTMLGKTEIVKAILTAYPVLLNSLGPHGLTLLHHAEKGGDEASELNEYLLSKGLKEKFIKLY